jgi:CRISPR/Cas system-associated exonuclease Cas4 (RecB family)
MINTWMRCPLQARFSYVDDIPQLQNAAASFGNCVHAAIEHFNKNGNAQEAEEFFLYYWDNPHVLKVVPDIWPKKTSFAGYREKGVQMVRDYVEHVKWSKREVIAVEHKFKIPFGKHELSGIIDVLEYTNGVLKIVDLKSGYRPTYEKLYLNIQFTGYWLATMKEEFWIGNGENYPGLPDGEKLYQKYKDSERQAIWFDLKNCREYNVGRRDDIDFMRLYRCCNEIEKAIENDVYVPNISGETCSFCSYTEICPTYISELDTGKAMT